MMEEETVSPWKKKWREWRGAFYVAVFVIIPVKSSLADWNYVPTGSMNPTILEGDLVYVNKLAYSLRFPLTFFRLFQWAQPRRGDIVICFSPDDNTRLVKRVIGLPGDVIAMKDNVLYINDQRLEYVLGAPNNAQELMEDLRKASIFAEEDLIGVKHSVMSIPGIEAMRSFSKTTVPKGSYFVMGDNRDASKDSRFFGFVEGGKIIGKASGVIFSFNKLDKYQPRLQRFFTPFR